ncbi:MAG TPA: J domain-containing protein [Myxococcota bacterium]|nr:J domain-containing protein [Myxococcota bacterium]
MIRALVLEHSPVRRAVFLGMLPSDQFEVRFPRSDEDWGAAFREFGAHVVLVWQEEPARFAATCARLRAQPGADVAALVLVTRRRAGELRAQALEAGADGLLALPAGVPEAREEIDAAMRARLGAGAAGGRTARPLPQAPSHDAGATAPAAAELPAPAAGGRSWAEFRAQVRRLYATLDHTTHYEILGVAATAPPHEITRAFHDAAIAYHPDRFVQLSDAQDRRMIHEIFKRMSKAFSVLTDPRQRAVYDASFAGPPTWPDMPTREMPAYSPVLAAPKGAAPPAEAAATTRTPQGRKFLEMAERSMQHGKLRAARLQLAIAMQWEPGNQVMQERIREVERRILENPESD